MLKNYLIFVMHYLYFKKMINAKKILLCPPVYYDIEYSINPWMHIEEKVNKKDVLSEYKELKKLYDKLQIPYDELTPTNGLPDQVYTTDTGVPVGKIFIKSNFRYGQRKPESAVSAAYFEKKGYAVYNLPPTVSFEGQGDLVRADHTYFMGWGQRTSYEAEDFLIHALQKEVVTLQLTNPNFFHLDTCFAPLSQNIAIYYPGAFTDEGKQTLDEYFEDLIAVYRNDANAFACNVIKIDNHILVNKNISDNLKKTLENYGFTVHGLKMTEYLKGGGSVKCVSLQIFR